MSAILELSELHFSACFFQLASDVVGFGLRNAFLHSFRSTVNEFLGFLQTEASQVFYNLNNVQLVSAGALQDNIERSFFFSSRSATTGSRASSNSYGSSSRLDAVLILQDGSEFVYFANSQVHELFSELIEVCHFLQVFLIV